ncbi:MAG: CopG family transcriptional regulator, partial [Oscillatoriales cyanobacterium]
MVKKSRNVASSDPESKVKIGLSLTPYSADRLNAIARKLDISRSELLERLAKGSLEISTDKTKVSVTWKKTAETPVDVAESPGETAEPKKINDTQTAQTPAENPTSTQPNPLQASYESLQQQLTERENSIAQLDAQLAEAKQNLEQ